MQSAPGTNLQPEPGVGVHSQPARGVRLELEDVSKVYQEGTPFAAQALEAVSLLIEPGERLAIAGPVGSGKSTLLSILAGMDRPATGRVLHAGREITRKNPPRPGSIGFAFQSPENCLFDKTVLDDVAFAPRRQGLGKEAAHSRARTALVTAGLDPERFGPRSPFSLSTGEQRRAALAGVLAMEPGALLLDEPTASLDPSARRELIAALVRINEETGVTMVMVGHDMDELARFAKRLIIIEGGNKVADAPAAAILTDTTLLAVHSLDPPGTVALCELIGEAIGSPIAPVLDEGAAASLLIDLMGKKG